MRIAIPMFGDRVSPRFDCAAEIRVFTLEADTVMKQSDLDASNWSPQQRLERLMGLGIDVVICGGIDRWSAASLMRAGIQVYGWVCGSIDDSLEALRRGELELEAEVAPRSDVPCCGAGGPRRRGHRRGGRQS